MESSDHRNTFSVHLFFRPFCLHLHSLSLSLSESNKILSKSVLATRSTTRILPNKPYLTLAPQLSLSPSLTLTRHFFGYLASFKFIMKCRKITDFSGQCLRKLERTYVVPANTTDHEPWEESSAQSSISNVTAPLANSSACGSHASHSVPANDIYSLLLYLTLPPLPRLQLTLASLSVLSLLHPATLPVLQKTITMPLLPQLANPH